MTRLLQEFLLQIKFTFHITTVLVKEFGSLLATGEKCGDNNVRVLL